jgi:hypothetical protein
MFFERFCEILGTLGAQNFTLFLSFSDKRDKQVDHEGDNVISAITDTYVVQFTLSTLHATGRK